MVAFVEDSAFIDAHELVQHSDQRYSAEEDDMVGVGSQGV